MQQSKKEEVTEPRPTPTLNEGTPTRVMLRELTISNPGVSINQGEILPEVSKIFGGAPITRRKVNLMECT